MAYSKNDIVQVTIEDIGVTGEGIGKIDGYTLFVKDTVIGDVVEVKIMKAKKNYGYARLMNIITPSKDRVTPECNIARQCGGCQLQAMSYAAQLKYKQKLVSDNLQRIGGLTEGVDYEMCDILGMDTPFRYRNKAQYPVGEDKDGNIIMGFYAGHTHSIIPCDDCLLGDENNSVILTAVKQWMKDYRVRAYNENIHKGTLRHILIRTGFHTDEIMVCLVTKKMLRKEAADGLVRVIERLNSGSSASDNISSGSDNNTSNNNTTRACARGFDRFWAAYPRKVGKGAAERSFERIRPDTALLDGMLRAIETQRQSDTWQRGYIPNPATWLNQRRWEDEPDGVTTPAAQQTPHSPPPPTPVLDPGGDITKLWGAWEE